MEFMIIMLVAMMMCFVFMIITQIVFWKQRQLARERIITDWAKFLNAERFNDIKSIKLYGDKLIWNRYISQEQIDRLNEVLASRLEKHPSLESLYEVTKNRRSYLSDDERGRIYGRGEMIKETFAKNNVFRGVDSDDPIPQMLVKMG